MEFSLREEDDSRKGASDERFLQGGLFWILKAFFSFMGVFFSWMVIKWFFHVFIFFQVSMCEAFFQGRLWMFLVISKVLRHFFDWMDAFFASVSFLMVFSHVCILYGTHVVIFFSKPVFLACVNYMLRVVSPV